MPDKYVIVKLLHDYQRSPKVMLNDTFTCWPQASELHFLSSTLQNPEGKSYLLF